MDVIDYAKALLDPDRLAVVGLVALRPRSVDDLAEATGLRERDVLAALAPLVQAGVVVADHDTYRLDTAVLRELAQSTPQPAPADQAVMFGMTTAEQEVLARFFRGRRLVEVPAQRAKRLIVLERIALDFEPGARYTEAEVNDVVSAYHDDYATLRRYLVDEGFLDREAGEYWRSGGRVEG